MPQYDFTYSSRIEEEDRMLQEVTALLARQRIAATEANSFLLAVSEAFNNALLHGNKSNPQKEIKLRVNINSAELNADIIDQGEGGLDRINRHQPAKLLAESGRGLDLIRHYATKARFAVHQDGGVKVSICVVRQKEECKS